MSTMPASRLAGEIDDPAPAGTFIVFAAPTA
jgi:hypothetical protein